MLPGEGRDTGLVLNSVPEYPEAREISDGAIISLDFQMGNLRTREGKNVSVDTQQVIGEDRTG